MCSSSPLKSTQILKPPREILDGIFAFPPNRDTLGGTAYFIVGKESNILIDCPAVDQTNQEFVRACGGIRWLVITHRSGIGKAEQWHKIFNCEIVIQEQEAYLLPELAPTTFTRELTLNSLLQVIWTPGHSPGSSCLYYQKLGGVLFSGRHLVPNQQGEPVPLRTAKTFHWPRQIKSVKTLIERFSPQTLQYICPSANTGFLRQKGAIDNAYQRLANLDLTALLQLQTVL
jgi:glyoxylase-like metal-dependent hydrolase (beta-lactamase superfamily II)